MPVIIRWDVIPHNEHRYVTCGDWYFTSDPDMLRVFVSKMSDPRYEQLVAFHETAEALICQQKGILEVDVTAFDEAYEATRDDEEAPCGCEHFDEPGDDPHAPYHEAHQAATACEKVMAKVLGVDWEAYDDEVESL